MSCSDVGNECQFDDQDICPVCHQPTGFWCVNCGDYYDGGASNFYGECDCTRKQEAAQPTPIQINVANSEEPSEPLCESAPGCYFGQDGKCLRGGVCR